MRQFQQEIGHFLEDSNINKLFYSYVTDFLPEMKEAAKEGNLNQLLKLLHFQPLKDEASVSEIAAAAASTGQIQMVQYLEAHYKFDRERAIHEACANGQLEMLRYFESTSPLKNIEEILRVTAIHDEVQVFVHLDYEYPNASRGYNLLLMSLLKHCNGIKILQYLAAKPALTDIYPLFYQAILYNNFEAIRYLDNMIKCGDGRTFDKICKCCTVEVIQWYYEKYTDDIYHCPPIYALFMDLVHEKHYQEILFVLNLNIEGVSEQVNKILLDAGDIFESCYDKGVETMDAVHNILTQLIVKYYGAEAVSGIFEGAINLKNFFMKSVLGKDLDKAVWFYQKFRNACVPDAERFEHLINSALYDKNTQLLEFLCQVLREAMIQVDLNKCLCNALMFSDVECGKILKRSGAEVTSIFVEILFNCKRKPGNGWANEFM